MKPEFESRRIYGITRAKGKMFEFSLPESQHIAIPTNSYPDALLLLTVGNLCDISSLINDLDRADIPLPPDRVEEIEFSANFFDAYLASGFSKAHSTDVILLASAAYYFARRPGSSLVLARQLDSEERRASLDAITLFLRYVLRADWTYIITLSPDSHPLATDLNWVSTTLYFFYQNKRTADDLEVLLARLRLRAYSFADARELSLIDILIAIVRLRLTNSVRQTLPFFSQIAAEQWNPIFLQDSFPKELWPAQIRLGNAGIFAGSSGVIQMPTSAGKTKAVEIILRSSFLSGRSRLTIVVAPFRALCHEISTSLRQSFKNDSIKVNELSDALQLDFVDQLAELFGKSISTSNYVLVLTPEKLLYVMRQTPALIKDIGCVIYDEGHQFDSGSRGITYELLLTEIKSLLPTSAQIILISAVIRNAQQVGRWLMGDNASIVDGTGLLPTTRSVAFATWLDQLGQLYFYESNDYLRPDYFVPRVIEQTLLKRFKNEKKDRYFPDRGKNAWKDVSLYLGIRLAPQGAVAIFCGRKDTATGVAERAVEIYRRDYAALPPSVFSNQNEIARLLNLIQCHFGKSSILARAAELGIFVHHGNTPHGLRLCIEHAMQHDLIKLIACTSTLAQGVNLPIRYLIVSGTNQGRNQIRTRDFQNLIGRAGRAGMHTEGLIIFADPNVYDTRFDESWRMNASINLLNPELTEEVSSSLLSIFSPLRNSSGRDTFPLNPAPFAEFLMSSRDEWATRAKEFEKNYGHRGFTAKGLISELTYRRRLLTALESYLMANREGDGFSEFSIRVQQLATSTLAYELADNDQKIGIVHLFELIAQHLEQITPEPERQTAYAKTLLGADTAIAIEAWVKQHREQLLEIQNSQNWLLAIWPLLTTHVEDKFLNNTAPSDLPMKLASLWIEGSSYGEIIKFACGQNATKSWGDERRDINDADVTDFIESTLSFDCSLIVAAVAQSLFGSSGLLGEESSTLVHFQKSFKYGLPDSLSISCYERGFSDRAVAAVIRDVLIQNGYSESYFGAALNSHREVIKTHLSNFPTYFEEVLKSLE